jgi:hypothetical protein
VSQTTPTQAQAAAQAAADAREAEALRRRMQAELQRHGKAMAAITKPKKS